MGHPSQLYIKFLIAKDIAKGDQVEFSSVNLILSAFNLPQVSEDVFDRLLLEAQPLQSVRWSSPRHKYTQEWLSLLGVSELRFPSATLKKTLELQYKPQIKEVIEILTLGRLDVSEICLRVEKRFKYSISEEVINQYAKYFWDIDNCSAAQWYALLAGMSCQDAYMAALQGTKDQALWRAGFNPQVDPRTALVETHLMVYMRLDALRNAPDTPETAALVAKYSRELVNLHSMCFGEGAQMSSTIKQLKNFVLEKRSTKAPDLRLVSSNGSYSDDGKPN